MLETIGTIMIVRIRIAGSRPTSDGAPWKNGRKTSTSFNHGSTWSFTTGPRTRIPHRPSTTLGTGADISTRAANGPHRHRGAGSVRKGPIGNEKGDERAN